jgi:hypothetical protein
VLDGDRAAFELVPGWISPSYGIRKQAVILRYSRECEVPFELRMLLVPVRAGQAVPSVERLNQLANRFSIRP